MNKLKINYSWVVLTMGTLVVFGALGLARYGYTMLLPSMQGSLGLDNSEAGLLATFNLAGYLGFALIGGALALRFGVRLVASLGLLLCGLGMIFTGLANEFFSVAFWRGVTGLGSGGTNVAIMGLLGAWFLKKRRGFAAGIAVSGSSLGLIFTGLVVPWMMVDYGDSAWRISWLIFGGITVLLAIASYLILRNNPSEIKTKLKSNIASEQNIKVSSDAKEEPSLWKRVYLSAPVWHLGLVYVAFGFSYIIYLTFFTKFLISDAGYTAIEAGKLFTIMGWVSVLCGIIWGSVSDLIGRKNSLIIIYLIHTVAFALFWLGNSTVFFTISAILFGLTAWSIPAIMAAACGDLLDSKLAPAALGFITLFFGVGQVLGPAVAGALADFTGSFSSAFFLASVVALLGAGGSAFLIKENSTPEQAMIQHPS